MKKLFFAFIVGLIILSCNSDKKETYLEVSNTQKEVATKIPEIKFENEFYDFGTIYEGEKKIYTFKFFNSGTTDLLIKAVIPDCGCTLVDWTKKPISPGDKGKIKIVFDSKGKLGSQLKTITLKTNTSYGKKSISIKANVLSSR